MRIHMCVRVYVHVCVCVCTCTHIRIHNETEISFSKKKINVSETFVSVRRPLYHPDSRNAHQRLYLRPRDVLPCVLRAAPALDI